CTRYFDTRHLLIAVNPNHIEMYESLLFFRRLTADGVDRYDFANGAPAVGATLDLQEAPGLFERAYAGKPGRRNLHRFFVHTLLPAIRFPDRPWHTSNDPVLTPALMQHFFAVRTQGFEDFDERRRRLLHSMYPGPEWARALPALTGAWASGAALRRHPRYSFKCPATFSLAVSASRVFQGAIVEVSATGFQAHSSHPLAQGARVKVEVELGQGVVSTVVGTMARRVSGESEQLYGFAIEQSDAEWQRCVEWLETASGDAASRCADTEPSCLIQTEVGLAC
ncbi:MAG: PilZ domain-containing protein, partial [Chitinophagaceae bacterium]|nr:PilZ domain-containing protein [Rubrivivax sp.]